MGRARAIAVAAAMGLACGSSGTCPAATTGSCHQEVAGETVEGQRYDPGTVERDPASCEGHGGRWTPSAG